MAEENEIKRNVQLQEACAETVDKIIEQRLRSGIRDTRARVIAEAVSELAKKELND